MRFDLVGEEYFGDAFEFDQGFRHGEEELRTCRLGVRRIRAGVGGNDSYEQRENEDEDEHGGRSSARNTRKE